MLQALVLLSSSKASTTFLSEPCTAVLKKSSLEEQGLSLLCATTSGRLYNLPHDMNSLQAWIQQKRASGELLSGETLLDIPLNTTIDKST